LDDAPSFELRRRRIGRRIECLPRRLIDLGPRLLNASGAVDVAERFCKGK